MRRVGLGGHLADLCDGRGQIAPHHLCHTEAPATETRVEPVAKRLGEIASFLGGRARRDRIAGDERRECLPAEDLAEPPPVS